MKCLCGLILLAGCSVDQEKPNQATDALSDATLSDGLPLDMALDAMPDVSGTENDALLNSPVILGEPICTSVSRYSAPPNCPSALLARLHFSRPASVPTACAQPTSELIVSTYFPNEEPEEEMIEYCLALAGLSLQSFTTEQTAPSCNVSATATRTVRVDGAQLEEKYAFRFDLDPPPAGYNQLIYTLEDHPECGFEVSFEYEYLESL